MIKSMKKNKILKNNENQNQDTVITESIEGKSSIEISSKIIKKAYKLVIFSFIQLLFFFIPTVESLGVHRSPYEFMRRLPGAIIHFDFREISQCYDSDMLFVVSISVVLAVTAVLYIVFQMLFMLMLLLKKKVKALQNLRLSTFFGLIVYAMGIALTLFDIFVMIDELDGSYLVTYVVAIAPFVVIVLINGWIVFMNFFGCYMKKQKFALVSLKSWKQVKKSVFAFSTGIFIITIILLINKDNISPAYNDNTNMGYFSYTKTDIYEMDKIKSKLVMFLTSKDEQDILENKLSEYGDRIEEQMETVNIDLDWDIKSYPLNKLVLTVEYKNVRNNDDFFRDLIYLNAFGLNDFNKVMYSNRKITKELLEEDNFKDQILNIYRKPGTDIKLTRSEYKNLSGYQMSGRGMIKFHGNSIYLIESRFGDSMRCISLEKNKIFAPMYNLFIVN